MIGISLFGIGLLGEYIGRIYQQVRHRPRYLVEAVLESSEKGKLEVKAGGEPDPFALAETRSKREKSGTAGEEAYPSLFSDSQE
jgi:hypothetical protein